MTAHVDAWRGYRWRCYLFGAAVVGALLLAPWSKISRAIGVLACILAFVRLMSWRCPRCGGRYFVLENTRWPTSSLLPPMVQNCLNCGLPKWEAPGLDDPDRQSTLPPSA